jgi:hypothetical protein
LVNGAPDSGKHLTGRSFRYDSAELSATIVPTPAPPYRLPPTWPLLRGYCGARLVNDGPVCCRLSTDHSLFLFHGRNSPLCCCPAALFRRLQTGFGGA